MIQITVRGVKGTKLRLEVPKAMTVSELIAKMELCHGYARAVGSLIFSGELLAEHKTLESCGVQTDSIIWFIVGKKHLAISRNADSDPTYQRSITVVLREDSKGTKWFLRLSPASTVAHLKKLVKGAIRIPESSQRLVFLGKVLDDSEATLSQIHYIEHYVIQLWVDFRLLKRATMVGAGDLSPVTSALVRKQLFGSKRVSLIEPLVSSGPGLNDNGNDNGNTDADAASVLDHPLAGTEMCNEVPELLSDGLGGTYMVKNSDGEPLAVFKPYDEEPQAPRNPRGLCGRIGGPALKRGIRAGEGALREVIAYVLDHDHSAGVPFTGMVYLNWEQLGKPVTVPTPLVQPIEGFSDGNRLLASSKGDSWKLGSIQSWQPNIGYAEDFGFQNFCVENVQQIAVHDIRVANLDRHSGNLLATRGNDHTGKPCVRLVPIDHGYTLPEYTDLEDISFEWLGWPQVAAPICRDVRKKIASLNVGADCARLRQMGLRSECVVTNFMCTTLLKKASARGYNLKEIGALMQRSAPSQPSDLELLRDRAMQRAKMMCKDLAKPNHDIAKLEEIMCAVFDEIVNLHLASNDKGRRPRSLSVVVENEAVPAGSTGSPLSSLVHAGRVSLDISALALDGSAAAKRAALRRWQSRAATTDTFLSSPRSSASSVTSSPYGSPTMHSVWSSDSSCLLAHHRSLADPLSSEILRNTLKGLGGEAAAPLPHRRSISFGGRTRMTNWGSSHPTDLWPVQISGLGH